MHLNWGIKGLDREDVGLWDPTDIGTLIMDDTFNIVPAQNQKALLDLCNKLKDGRIELVKDNEVTCWILDMQEMIQNDSRCSGGKQMPLVNEN